MKKSWMLGILGALLALIATVALIVNWVNNQNQPDDNPCVDGYCERENCGTEENNHHRCCCGGTGIMTDTNCPEGCTIEYDHHHYACTVPNCDREIDPCPEGCTVEGEHHHHECCCCCHFGPTEKPVEPEPGPGTDVPSVGQDGAPALTDFVDESGERSIAIVRDENNVRVESWPREELKLIPMADRNEESVPEEQKLELETAYQSIAQAKDLGQIAMGLDRAMRVKDTDLKVEDLVALELFYVDIPAGAKELLYRLDDSKITTMFHVDGVEPGDTIFFMQYLPISGVWHVIEPMDVWVLQGGYIRASFTHDIGTVAILGVQD